MDCLLLGILYGHVLCRELRFGVHPVYTTTTTSAAAAAAHITRSSAIRRESAHLTWLHRTVQMAFQYETVEAWHHQRDRFS